MRSKVKVILAAALLMVLLPLTLVSCTGKQGLQGPAGAAGPAGSAGAAASAEDINNAITAKFTTADTKLPLWAVQPGTAPKMLELTQHFNIMWYAAQAGNWDVVTFEKYRVEETIKANVVVRPGRKDLLEAWSKPVVEAIGKAATEKNLDNFVKAYDAAIVGCNACHAGSGGGPLSTMKAYKITRPTAPMFSNIDLKP